MIVVFNESRGHAEVVAIFADEEAYNLCLPQLEGDAKKHRMKVTDFVKDVDLSDMVECLQLGS